MPSVNTLLKVPKSYLPFAFGTPFTSKTFIPKFSIRSDLLANEIWRKKSFRSFGQTFCRWQLWELFCRFLLLFLFQEKRFDLWFDFQVWSKKILQFWFVVVAVVTVYVVDVNISSRKFFSLNRYFSVNKTKNKLLKQNLER